MSKSVEVVIAMRMTLSRRDSPTIMNPDTLWNLIAGPGKVVREAIEQSFMDDSIKEQLLTQSQTCK